MTTRTASTQRLEAAVRHAILWLQRAAGLALFGFGLLYWVRIVGLYPGADWRFDLMSLPWRVAAPTLAVVCPVAGVGLWLAASWGTVVWTIVATVEGVMRFVFRATFGGPDVELAFHAFGLAALVALRLVGWWLGRRNRVSRRTG